MGKWQDTHGQTIKFFLDFLNKKSDIFILKGGTALSTCYGLNRFSEDIDLDGTQRNMEIIVDQFCTANGYTYRSGKDTHTVQRYFINYGNIGKPLKIETSYRRKEIPDNEITCINGINVYTINSLCIMKSNAYSGRDKIRDLFDLSFIVNNCFDRLDASTVLLVQSVLQTKGIEQFDYLIQTQADELIDKDKLETEFLKMHEKLGLLVDEAPSNGFASVNS